MQLIPAIDMKNGECVRLKQGRMDDATVYSSNPVEMAGKWYDLGARRIHLVDLDGAFAGKPRNGELVTSITKAYPDMEVEIGGGIRTREIADSYIQAGVKYLIIGSAAVTNPEFVDELCQAYPGQIIVGLDARDGMVATEGWDETSSVSAVDLAKRFASSGVKEIIYTDIGRDGMLSGFNVEATEGLAKACGIPVIASGGIRDLDDIHHLLAIEKNGVTGAILGRSIYEGTLDFSAAQALVTA